MNSLEKSRPERLTLDQAAIDQELFQAEIELAKRSLSEYVEQAWHLVEPATPFVRGWHLDAICYHLEAITAGEIKNLCINIPPRYMKSLGVSVFWPTWEWGPREMAHLRYLYFAYGERLSIRDTGKSARIIQSSWYQDRFGDSFYLTENAKMKYENNHRGFRIGSGIGGMATGEGADRLVMDDPHKVADAHSDAVRETALTFWNETIPTRLNNPETGAKVVIMQRIHDNDLTGDIIEKMEAGGEQYEMLVLPAEYEPKRQEQFTSSLNWKDPRTEEGELLWPGRFSRENVEGLKVSLGEQASGQLQQRPVPAGGAIFKSEWWEGKNRYDATDYSWVNKAIGTWVAWDTANKKEDRNAFTAGVAGSLLPDYRLLIRYVVMQRKSFDELTGFVTEETHPFNNDLKLKEVLIEDAASGTQLLQVLAASGEPWIRERIVAVPPEKLGKEANWEAAANWCRQGCILLPEPSDEVPWLHSLEDPLFKVPVAKFVDVIDALAHLVNYIEEHYRAFSTYVRAMRAKGARVRAGREAA